MVTDMNANLSVLRNAKREQVKLEPFPHIIIHDAVEETVFRELEQTFPDYSCFTTPDSPIADRKYMVRAHDIQSARIDLPVIWKDFVDYHTSKQFFDEVISLFGPELEALYGRLETVLDKPFAEMTTEVRKKGLRPNLQNENDVMLDCQPYIDCNFTSRQMRGPHVDAPEEIYSGLLYMRDSTDDSTGGSLEILEPLDAATAFPSDGVIRYPVRGGFDRKRTKRVAKLEYDRNVLILFLNSYKSLHSVETRTANILPRRAVNLIGEVARYDQFGLFTVEQPADPNASDQTAWRRRARSFAGRVKRRLLG